jgi:hypothetical protein
MEWTKVFEENRANSNTQLFETCQFVHDCKGVLVRSVMLNRAGNSEHPFGKEGRRYLASIKASENSDHAHQGAVEAAQISYQREKVLYLAFCEILFAVKCQVQVKISILHQVNL